MSEENHAGNHVGDLTIPGKNGGRLRNGGTNRGGTGRPPNEIRRGFRRDLPTEARKLKAHVREIEREIAKLAPLRESETVQADRHTKRIYDLERLIDARQRLADFLAKYGLGTTFTETDTEGNDVPRPGILTQAERRAALVEALRN